MCIHFGNFVQDSTPLRVKATKSSRRGPKVFDNYSVQNEAPQVTTGIVCIRQKTYYVKSCSSY